MINVSIEDLKFKSKFGFNCGQYQDGYRIVYFYSDNTYSVGAFCKTIEGFMIGFAECDPIIDEDDIPEFISIDDLLNRYLNEMNNIVAVALYKTDGTCLEMKKRCITK